MELRTMGNQEIIKVRNKKKKITKPNQETRKQGVEKNGKLGNKKITEQKSESKEPGKKFHCYRS